MDLGNKGCAYPFAEVLALPAIAFDHSPLLLFTEAVGVRKRRTFYFESYWLQDKKCRDVVAQSWASPQLGPASLLQKLRATSFALSLWSRAYRKRIGHLLLTLRCVN